MPSAAKGTGILSIVPSAIEYAAAIYGTLTKLEMHAKSLENIQRKATRFVKNDYYYTSSVAKMLIDLG